jgi:hypothetical protein
MEVQDKPLPVMSSCSRLRRELLGRHLSAARNVVSNLTCRACEELEFKTSSNVKHMLCIRRNHDSAYIPRYTSQISLVGLIDDIALKLGLQVVTNVTMSSHRYLSC